MLCFTTFDILYLNQLLTHLIHAMIMIYGYELMNKHRGTFGTRDMDQMDKKEE